jgi:LPXTG-motif cell wall-anchored protein
LSHFGFDDNPPPPEDIVVSGYEFSPAFTTMLIFAGVAFIAFTGLFVIRRRRDVEKYDSLPTNDGSPMNGRMGHAMQQPNAAAGSYQREGGAPYNPMGAVDQKTVTYCVIDQRMVS